MDRREFLAAAAAVPFTLRSRTQRRVALVTADLEAAVVVVDVDAGRVLRRIETRPDPRSIERVGEDAVVAHTAIGEVTILRGLQIRRRRDASVRAATRRQSTPSLSPARRGIRARHPTCLDYLR